MASETREYSLKEVAEHKTPDDAWIIIHGKVYDVTTYQQDHPGGAAVLTEAAGTDATDDFDNAGHSEDAFEEMATYLVGTLKGYVKKKQRLKPVAPQTAQASDEVVSHTKKTLSVAKISSLAVFTVAVAGLYYVNSQNTLRIPRWLTSQIHKERPGQVGSYGFIKGLLAGGSVFAVLDALIAHRFASEARSHKSFTSYPPHKKVPKRVPEDTLLARGVLDPVQYAPLPLREKIQISPNVFRFIFDLPTRKTILGLPIGQHVAIKADINGESVARSYTPVSNNSDLGILELVVKVYPDGKLTNQYLSTLEAGDEVLFRGPKGAMRYRPGLCSHIGMIAGGTGITPMFQIIRAVCEHDRDLTKISLIYANRTEGDILLREELDRFARRYPEQFKVYYVLDQPPEEGWEGGKGYVTKEMMEEKLPGPAGETKVMLCGPPGMVKAAKGALGELGFEKPGAMAKMTDQVFLF